jgi:hypothetical protein
MIKRYKKTPHKYAVPLLCIGVLVLAVSISGCPNNTNSTPTPTPSAAPTTKASFDPLLVKMEQTLKTQYPSAVGWKQSPKNENQTNDELLFLMTSNGKDIYVDIRNYSSTDEASGVFRSLSTPDSTNKLAPGCATYLGQQAATVALGHAPSTVQDVYLKGIGQWAGVDNEYIQFDHIVMLIDIYPVSV